MSCIARNWGHSSFSALPKKRNVPITQRGSVLLPVVVAIVLLAAVTFMLNYGSVTETTRTSGELERDRLRYVTEAGLAHARLQLASKGSCSGYTSLPETGFAGDSYSAAISPTAGSPVTIAVTGKLKNGISQTVGYTPIPVYEAPMTVMLQLSKDTGKDVMIDDFYPNANYGSIDDITVRSGSWIQRPLIEFDLSGIPANANIISAVLDLQLRTVSTPGDVGVHRMTQSWLEGTGKGTGNADGATWNDYDGNAAWSQPGGDFDSTLYATAYVSSAKNGQRVTWDIRNLVDGWVAGRFPNFGLMLTDDGAVNNAQFASREDADPTAAPRLTIVYACECGKTCTSGSPARQPLAHWKLDEGSGTLAADSIGGHDGTLNGPTWSGGALGGGLWFDDADDVVTAPHAEELSLTSEFTLTAWIRKDSSNDLDTAIEKSSGPFNRNYYLGTRTGEVVFGFTNASFAWQDFATTGAALQDGTWYHIAGVFDNAADTVRIYLSGAELDNFTTTQEPVTNSNGIYLGRSPAGGAWGGSLDDLRIYDVALTAAEIADLAAEANLGPIAHWKLDETSGTVAVDSVGGNDATLQNGPVWTTGQVGGGLDFDGADDTVSAGAPATLQDIFDGGGTLTAWMHPDGWGENTYGRIVDKSGATYPGDGWALELYGGNSSFLFQTGFSTGTGSWRTPTGSVSLGAWQHVALVYDTSSTANDPEIYIDGVQQTITELDTPSGTLRSDAGINFTIGNHAMSTVRTFNGQLDDIRVYDRMLSAAEIAELATPPAATPIAHWKLDDGTGLIAVDSEGGNDGTLTNGPVWVAGQIGGALDFDGVNDYVEASTLDVSGSGLTLMAWFNAETIPTSDGRFISKATGPNEQDAWWQLSTTDVGSNRYLRMRIKAGGMTTTFADSTVNLVTGQWYFAVGTYDAASGDMRLYLDGAEVANRSHAVGGAIDTDPSVPVAIGANGTVERFFDGILDDVRIYDRALSAAEISELFTAAGGGGGGGGGSCNGNFRDSFDARSFTGSDGSLSWATDWVEVGESDGPTSGDIQVMSDQSNYELRTRDNDNGGEGVQREADLSGAATATLNYDYRRMNLDGISDYTSVEVSANGASGPWTELTRHSGSGNDSSYQPASHPITPYISANTRIRFKTSSTMGRTDTVWFDNIEITCTP